MKMQGLVMAKDVNALVAASQPRMFTCSATNRFGMGGTNDICTGFPDGASRPGFQDPQGGEGHLDTEAGFRAYAARIFEAAGNVSTAPDAAGPPQARIGSLSCERAPTAPPSMCGNDYVWVHITFINAPGQPPERALGLPGQRTTFGISAHRDASGELKVDGIGVTTVPPNSVLEAGESPSSFGGKPGVVRRYAWTP
jgi:hypothetical protein